MRTQNTKLIAGAAAVVVAGLAVGVWPNLKSMESLGSQKADLVSRVQRSDDGDAALKRLRATLDEEQQRAEAVLREIPLDGDVGGFIREMSAEVARLGLGRPEIKTGRPIEHDDAKALPMTVEITGTFLQMVSVVEWVESLERLVRVRKLTVDPAVRSNGEDFSDAFTADVVLDVYYAPTFKAPEAPQVTADAGDE